MPSIDERVVVMKFDNASFESKLGETIKSLDMLKKSLDFANSKKSMEDLNTAGKNFDISHIGAGVEAIAGKFTALGAIGFSVIQKLTQTFMGFAGSLIGMAKTDILEPIITGGKQRALNIEQAKFMFKGLGIDVQAGMDSALKAVQGTAYGLDAAAKAAAQFGASGIKVGDEMTGALRGVAGAAAMTGTSFSEMADIFAGSAGSGKVTNQDLMQFATRGLNAAAAVGKQMGKTEAQIHDMATAGTLDFKTFAKAMDDAFGAHATEANQTYSGSLANMHAAMSRLGAAFFTPKLSQMRDVFNAITPNIDAFAKAFQPVIDVFTWFGQVGSAKMVDFLNKLDFSNVKIAMPNFAVAIANAFQGVGQIIGVVKDAFRDIFPKSETSKLVEFSQAVRDFSEHLKMGGETIDKVKSIFKGFFSVIDIGWTIFKEIVHLIGSLIGAISPAGKGLLDAAAAGGDFLTKMDQLLVKEGAIHNFFIKLGEVAKAPIVFIQELKDKIVSLFSGDTIAGADGATAAFGRVQSRIDNLRDLADKVSEAWQRMGDRLQGVKDVLDKVWDYVKNWFASFGQRLAAAFQPGDFNNAVDLINVGLLGGIAVLLEKFWKSGLKVDFSSGLVQKIKEALGGVTGALKAMQTDLKADALMKIAIAMGVLTASIVVLSMIDSGALTKALTAISVGFAQLVLTMTAMDKVVGSTGSAAKLGILGAALIEIAIAVGILSIAVAGMSKLGWAELAKGLAGVGGGLLLMIGAAALLSQTGGAGSLVALGAGLILVSAGLLILGEAMKLFAGMSWADMGKGLVGIGGGLLVVALAMNLMPASSVISGLGFIEVAIGLNILYTAVKLFSDLGWAEMLKGMVGVGAGLLIIAGAMNLMPLTLPITALGLMMVASALGVMAGVILLMGQTDLGTLAKGIGALAVVLLILAIGVNAMNSAVVGAVAMVVVAGALSVLAGVIKTLGDMKVGDIIKGLAAIAGVLVVLGLAALVMEPIIPALMGLGIAIALVGAGFLLFGAGAWFVARALQAMAESGVAGAKAFVESIQIMIGAIPAIVGAVALAIVGSGEELLKAMPLLLRILEAVLLQLLQTIIDLAPKLAEAIGVVLTNLLQLIRDKFPDLVETGFQMLLALLQGVSDHIDEIVNVVVDIVTGFVKALTDRIPDIAQSLYDFILSLAEEVAYRAGELQTAFIPIGMAFLQGLWDGLQQNAPLIASFFTELVPKIFGWIGDVLGTLWQKGVDLLQGLWNGLTGKIGDIWNFFTSLPGKIIGWIGDTVPTLFSKGWDVLVGLMNGLGQKERELIGWVAGLPWRIITWIGNTIGTLWSKGWDIIQGLINGLIAGVEGLATWVGSLPGKFLSWIPNPLTVLEDIGKSIMKGLQNGLEWGWHKVTDALSAMDPRNWKGPPKRDAVILVDNGKLMMRGLQDGLEAGWNDVTNWLTTLDASQHVPDPSNDIGASLQKSLTDMVNSLPTMSEFNPVITPVLDLTTVRTQAKELNTLVAPSAITPTVSIDKAQLIATTGQIAAPGIVTEPVQQGPQNITFEQNIYSPDPLSTSDIYRSTKSQIVLAKEALGIS